MAPGGVGSGSQWNESEVWQTLSEEQMLEVYRLCEDVYGQADLWRECMYNKTQQVSEQEMEACGIFSWFVHGLFMGIVCLLGVLGNFISFAVFWRDPVKSSTHFLLQALAVVDSLLLLTALPLHSIPSYLSHTSATHYQNYLYQVFPFAVVYAYPVGRICQTITVWLTVLIGLNRYVAVCRPYEAYRLCSLPKTRRYLTLIVLLALVYNIPHFFNNQLERTQIRTAANETLTLYSINRTALAQSWPYSVFYNNILYTLCMLIVPLATLCLLNVFLVRALAALRRKRFSMLLQQKPGEQRALTERNQHQQQRHDNSITLMLIVVIVVFVVCQSPAIVTQLLWSFLPFSSSLCGGVTFYFGHITNLLVSLNSAANVVIYVSCNTRFRHILCSSCSRCTARCRRGAGLPAGNTSQYTSMRLRAFSNQTDAPRDALLSEGHALTIN